MNLTLAFLLMALSVYPQNLCVTNKGEKVIASEFLCADKGVIPPSPVYCKLFKLPAAAAKLKKAYLYPVSSLKYVIVRVSSGSVAAQILSDFTSFPCCIFPCNVEYLQIYKILAEQEDS